MVTDRCTTACLLCYLCSAYPAYTFWFQAIISVDLASHYMHMYRYLHRGTLEPLSVSGIASFSVFPSPMCYSPCVAMASAPHRPFASCSSLTHLYSTLNQGVSSHKKIPKEQSWILRQYYGNNIVLFLFCACNELFFVSIYLLSFPPPPNSPPRLGRLPLPHPVSLRFPVFNPCFFVSLFQFLSLDT